MRKAWPHSLSLTLCDVGPRDGLQNEAEVLEPAVRAELVQSAPREHHDAPHRIRGENRQKAANPHVCP